MQENMTRNYVSRIAAAMFCLMLLIYGQSGYAEIEKYLTPMEGNLYMFGTPSSRVRVDSMELAAELVDYLSNNKLHAVYIKYIHKDVRRLVLDALAEALRNSSILTKLSQIGRAHV